jgi:hypothetical protein
MKMYSPGRFELQLSVMKMFHGTFSFGNTYLHDEVLTTDAQ